MPSSLKTAYTTTVMITPAKSEFLQDPIPSVYTKTRRKIGLTSKNPILSISSKYTQHPRTSTEQNSNAFPVIESSSPTDCFRRDPKIKAAEKNIIRTTPTTGKKPKVKPSRNFRWTQGES